MAFKLIPAAQIIGPITSADVLYYSTVSAEPDTLILSVSAAGGTDEAGNEYLPGETAYIQAGSLWLALQNTGAAIHAYASAAGENHWNGIGVLAFGLTDPALLTGPFFTLSTPLVIGSGTRSTAAAAEIAGPAALADAAAPAAAAGWAQPFGSAGALNVVDGGDGSTYDMQRLTLPVGAQTITHADGTVTLASAPVAARTYKVNARVVFRGSAAAGTAGFFFTGPAASGSSVEQQCWSYPAGSPVIPSITGAVPTAGYGAGFTSPTLATTGFMIYKVTDAIITFSAAGTLGLAAVANVAGDNVSIFAGGFLQLEPVVA